MTSLNIFRIAEVVDIDILGPDINDSEKDFSITASGQIRFGLSGHQRTRRSGPQSDLRSSATRKKASRIFHMPFNPQT